MCITAQLVMVVSLSVHKQLLTQLCSLELKPVLNYKQLPLSMMNDIFHHQRHRDSLKLQLRALHVAILEKICLKQSVLLEGKSCCVCEDQRLYLRHSSLCICSVLVARRSFCIIVIGCFSAIYLKIIVKATVPAHRMHFCFLTLSAI